MLDIKPLYSTVHRRDWSSLLLFHKIHSGPVSIEKDKYLTPANSLKSTRASHSAQYRRYQTYSDAMKNSFSPKLFHNGMVFLLRWSIHRLLRSLGHSSFSKKHSRNIFLVFCCLFFIILQNSKFELCNEQLVKLSKLAWHRDCNFSLMNRFKRVFLIF